MCVVQIALITTTSTKHTKVSDNYYSLLRARRVLIRKYTYRYDLGNELEWGFRHTGESRYPSIPSRPGCRPRIKYGASSAPAWRITGGTLWRWGEMEFHTL